jgi:ATP-binding protein involved in chromosome partitioning
MPITTEQAQAALRGVKDPELHRDIVSLNMVKSLEITGDAVRVTVNLTTPACPMKETIRNDVTNALIRAGAGSVDVELTAKPKGDGAGGQAGGGPGGNAPGAQPGKGSLPQVKYIIAVGAGKGGVGKSTVAANLAIGLARGGARVGLMDGDIYGPSMPTMLGLKGKTPQLHGPKMIPFFVHGIHAVTIGSIVQDEQPLIWRGPMAHGAFKQLLLDKTIWPQLDYLIVDLPPGTGDVPLTLCQLLPLTGAVVVATPQQVALDDAVRAVRMFQQLEAPVLGIVENMSYVPLPDGQILDMFGRGGAEIAAQRLGLPFLGAIPMVPALRKNSDAGTPHANFESDPLLGGALMKLVENLQAQVAIRQLQNKPPELNIS